eukprot:1176195-Prorocentrum_minimum.AAC.2
MGQSAGRAGRHQLGSPSDLHPREGSPPSPADRPQGLPASPPGTAARTGSKRERASFYSQTNNGGGWEGVAHVQPQRRAARHK